MPDFTAIVIDWPSPAALDAPANRGTFAPSPARTEDAMLDDRQRFQFVAHFGPDQAAAAWPELKAAIVAANPKFSPLLCGEMAALGILARMRAEAVAYVEWLDLIARTDEWDSGITDAMDDAYRNVWPRLSATQSMFERLSGVRVWGQPHPAYTAEELFEAAGLEFDRPRPCAGCRGEAACCSCV